MTRNKSVSNVLLSMILIVCCAYLTVSTVNLWHSLSESKNELKELVVEAEKTQNEINELNNRIKNSTEKEIIESAARDQLNYAYPDEKIFIDISGY